MPKNYDDDQNDFLYDSDGTLNMEDENPTVDDLLNDNSEEEEINF